MNKPTMAWSEWWAAYCAHARARDLAWLIGPDLDAYRETYYDRGEDPERAVGEELYAAIN